MLRLGGAFFLNPRYLLSRCRNEKESGAGTPHSKAPGERGYGTRLVVIRLIRIIRGLNILSFQLQNHSTSLMPIRRIGLRERVHSFFSIRENPFLAVSSVFYFYQTARHKYDLASCAFGTPFGEQTVLPKLISFAPPRLCASLFQLL